MLHKIWALLKFVASLPVRLVLRIVDDLFGDPKSEEVTHIVGILGIVVGIFFVISRQLPWWEIFGFWSYAVFGYWAVITTLELFWKAVQYVRDMPTKLAAKRLSSSHKILEIDRLSEDQWVSSDFVGIGEQESINLYNE